MVQHALRMHHYLIALYSADLTFVIVARGKIEITCMHLSIVQRLWHTVHDQLSQRVIHVARHCETQLITTLLTESRFQSVYFMKTDSSISTKRGYKTIFTFILEQQIVPPIYNGDINLLCKFGPNWAWKKSEMSMPSNLLNRLIYRIYEKLSENPN